MRTIFAALLILTCTLSAAAQEMNGFELREDKLFWTGTFTSRGRDAENLRGALLDNLSTVPYIGQVRAASDGTIVGSIKDLPEALSSTGMFVFSFGFIIDPSDEQYTVTTKDWVAKSTNPTFSGGVKRLEELLWGPLIGNKRRANFYKAHETAQIDIFGLK